MDCKVVIPRRIRFLISVVNRCIDKLTQQSLINHIKCKLNSKINIRPKRYGRYRTAAAVASLGKFPNSGDCPASMCPTIIVTEKRDNTDWLQCMQGHLPLQKEEETKSSAFDRDRGNGWIIGCLRPPLMDKVTL